jgi:hypothetical protein
VFYQGKCISATRINFLKLKQHNNMLLTTCTMIRVDDLDEYVHVPAPALGM